jgi:hypothetical protein
MRRKGALLPPDEILASVNLISQELITLVCEHIDDTLESAAGMDESKGEEPTVLAPAEKVWYEVPLRLPS